MYESELENYDPEILEHYGTKGQKWGIRRYQNPDGTLTELGKKRYGKYSNKLEKIDKKYEKKQAKADAEYAKAEKKLNGRFGSMKKGVRTFAKASKSQYKANRVAYKGLNWYNSMGKTFGESYVSNVDKKAVALGEKYKKRIETTSAMMYSASIAKRFS